MHVKPAGTSAAITTFCAAKIEGPGGFLWVDGNGKITAGNGTLDDPKPNAFSLVQIEDCPGATDACKASCYVHGLQKHAGDTHALYRHNSKEIRRILDGPHPVDWAWRLGDYIVENCHGGFRWHVSGDVFSDQYARWIADVCRASPGVRHWIYTRSFARGTLTALADTRNLTLNLSCDRDNYAKAAPLAEHYGARLCYMTQTGEVPGDLPDGSVIFPDYNLRGGTELGQAWFGGLPQQYKSFVCPVDYHGKAENRRCGPCDRCLKRAQ